MARFVVALGQMKVVLRVLLCYMLVLKCHGGCSTDLDCELNGVCVGGGTCRCDQGWTGETCAELDLLPVSVDAGFRQLGQASWGGNVVQENKTKFHFFVSDIDGNCGLTAWYTNSQIVRATSDKIEGPYKKEEVVVPVWSHNPQVARVPDEDTLLLFHIGLGRGKPQIRCPGKNGTTPCPPHSTWLSGETFEERGKQYTFPIHFSDSVYGPWKEHTANISFDVGNNANPAPLILKNGTTFVLFNALNFAIGVADHWKGPYRLRNTHSCGTGEDPFLYLDKRGRFHCLAHAAPFKYPSKSIVHSFSEDGYEWTTSAKVAGGSKVKFDNGKSILFSKRERPKFLFDKDGEITHLITGVTMLPECTPDFLYPDGRKPETFPEVCRDEEKLWDLTDHNPCPGHYDRAYSLIQTIRQKKDEILEEM